MLRFLLMPLYILRFLTQSILIAIGQIWSNRTRSVLTVIGIIIGVAAVIQVIAALSGLKAAAPDQDVGKSMLAGGVQFQRLIQARHTCQRVTPPFKIHP